METLDLETGVFCAHCRPGFSHHIPTSPRRSTHVERRSVLSAARQSDNPNPNKQVAVHGLSVRFGATEAIRDVHLSVAEGEFVALLGPSGCGKSTLLNVIAGLIEPDSGQIELRGIDSNSRLGHLAYMPQRDALLPWRTVLDNAILGLEVAGRDRQQAREQARELLPRFGLETFGDSYPSALSGGMRQRAAFLRTVLSEQPVMLLDEPFGALDALTRRAMQEWLLDLWTDLGRTILMVTHDVEEALLLADRVAVMTARPGRIKLVEKVRLPRPRNADMIGDPEFVAQKLQLLSALRGEMAPIGGRS
ncbi:MAG: ABC transporter ATP-binding protein [Chloroflexia bacterium]|nr:ABC transporter ATP-binding protein [Chloroflexia bacterium]